MSVDSCAELARHVGHKLACVLNEADGSVAVECEDCRETVLHRARPDDAPSDSDADQGGGEVARVREIAICECIGEQLDRGETCGTVRCPNHPAVLIIKGDDWGDDELIREARHGRWEAVAEIAENHASIQSAAGDNEAAAVLREFAELARAETLA